MYYLGSIWMYCLGIILVCFWGITWVATVFGQYVGILFGLNSALFSDHLFLPLFQKKESPSQNFPNFVINQFNIEFYSIIFGKKRITFINLVVQALSDL